MKTIVFGALAVMLILASAASQAQEFPAAILEHARFTYTAPMPLATAAEAFRLLAQ